MAAAETQELAKTTLRGFRPGDETLFLEILKESFSGLEYLPRIKLGLSNPAFNREGAFIAEKAGSPVGCVGFFNQPREKLFEVRYLGVRDENSRQALAEKLLARAVQYAESKAPEFLKGFTLAVQPYVDVYRGAGFEPVRRHLRIGWDLTKKPETNYGAEESLVSTKNLSQDLAEEASQVWVKGLRPYWDWWVEEQGGPEAAGLWVKESVRKGENWTGAFLDDRLVGTTMLWPNFYGPGEARFNGVMVLPEFRGKRAGSALMGEALRKARQLDQKRLNVYTVAYLDHLAPGAVLYLKSGGRIEAEYLQLERR